MMWFFAIVIVLALGAIAAVAAGKGAPLAEAYDDRPDATVPAEGTLGPDDLRRVRFTIALRGYRMSEVDALLDRLASEREREREREHGSGRGGPLGATGPTGPADPPETPGSSDAGRGGRPTA